MSLPGQPTSAQEAKEWHHKTRQPGGAALSPPSGVGGKPLAQKSYRTAQFRRFAARIGGKRALIAVAHSILTIAYHLLRKKQTYQDLGPDYFNRLTRSRFRTVSSDAWSALATLSYLSPKEPLRKLIFKESLTQDTRSTKV